MACQGDPVFRTPCAQFIQKARGESLGNIIVIVVTRVGNLAARQIPNDFRKTGQNIITVFFVKTVGQRRRPWKNSIVRAVCECKRLLFHKLRLVSKNRGHRFTKLIADGIFICVVGDLNELIDRFWVHQVSVGLIIVPRVVRRGEQIGVPFCPVRRTIFID